MKIDILDHIGQIYDADSYLILITEDDNRYEAYYWNGEQPNVTLPQEFILDMNWDNPKMEPYYTKLLNHIKTIITDANSTDKV